MADAIRFPAAPQAPVRASASPFQAVSRSAGWDAATVAEGGEKGGEASLQWASETWDEVLQSQLETAAAPASPIADGTSYWGTGEPLAIAQMPPIVDAQMQPPLRSQFQADMSGVRGLARAGIVMQTVRQMTSLDGGADRLASLGSASLVNVAATTDISIPATGETVVGAAPQAALSGQGAPVADPLAGGAIPISVVRSESHIPTSAVVGDTFNAQGVAAQVAAGANPQSPAATVLGGDDGAGGRGRSGSEGESGLVSIIGQAAENIDVAPSQGGADAGAPDNSVSQQLAAAIGPPSSKPGRPVDVATTFAQPAAAATMPGRELSRVLVVRLEPAELGPVTMHLRSRGGAIDVTIRTGDQAVASLIETQKDKLVEDLKLAGHVVKDVAIAVDPGLRMANARQDDQLPSPQGQGLSGSFSGGQDSSAGRGGERQSTSHNQIREAQEFDKVGAGFEGDADPDGRRSSAGIFV